MGTSRARPRAADASGWASCSRSARWAIRPLEASYPRQPLPAAALHGPIPVRFTLDAPGYVTLVIESADGRRVRNLVSETPFPAGPNTVWWDATDDLARDVDAARHGVYHVPARLVSPGEYRVRGLYHAGIDLRYEFAIYNAGSPAWSTADHTGGWLTNHTPPSSALFVPGGKAPEWPTAGLPGQLRERRRRRPGLGRPGGTQAGRRGLGRRRLDRSALPGPRCRPAGGGWDLSLRRLGLGGRTAAHRRHPLRRQSGHKTHFPRRQERLGPLWAGHPQRTAGVQPAQAEGVAAGRRQGGQAPRLGAARRSARPGLRRPRTAAGTGRQATASLSAQSIRHTPCAVDQRHTECAGYPSRPRGPRGQRAGRSATRRAGCRGKPVRQRPRQEPPGQGLRSGRQTAPRHRHCGPAEGRTIRSAPYQQSQRADHRQQRPSVGGRDRFPTEAGQRLDARRPPGPRLLRPLGIRRRRPARSRGQDAILLPRHGVRTRLVSGRGPAAAGLLPSRPRGTRPARRFRRRWSTGNAALPDDCFRSAALFHQLLQQQSDQRRQRSDAVAGSPDGVPCRWPPWAAPTIGAC